MPTLRTDQVLTDFVQGYEHPEFVFDALFPRIPVSSGSVVVPDFGDNTRKIYTTRRAPGGQVAVVQLDPSERTVALENHDIDCKVPFEDVEDYRDGPGVDLQEQAMIEGMEIVNLKLEFDAGVLATTAGNYTNAANVAATPWNAKTGGASDHDPMEHIEAGREAVLTSAGRYPNVAVFGAPAWASFKHNSHIIERIKYVNLGRVTTQVAADLLEVDRVAVAPATYLTPEGAVTSIWGANCVLARVARPGASARARTFGACYTRRGYPLAGVARRDDSHRSFLYPYSDRRIPAMVTESAGYLIHGING